MSFLERLKEEEISGCSFSDLLVVSLFFHPSLADEKPGLRGVSRVSEMIKSSPGPVSSIDQIIR
ncbi:hypothetical protein [Emcibacter nanhaiensis]|uniref:Uncharacterized protein n=1 Tax=Emcibacter nanhaiensis TaxID=1505037 RepID=A0A501PLW7_9PROT|nr:hypothetical protein [Emcibacter nanhaiensis]TPD60766.1 hypothetical protein FIV46_08575 [Emcibacter nanhaiensis]